MSNKAVIQSNDAPRAIGPYSQAVKVGQTTYLSGQIALDPESMELVGDNTATEAEQVFRNLAAVATAAGAELADAVKVNVYLVDLGDFAAVNAVMERWFSAPYPARACVQVAALPRGARVEVDAILAR